MPDSIAAANATFCAALVDQWIADGLTAAYIAPGSRSTPVSLALAQRNDLRVELFHDERGASFAALGHGLATGTPAVVVCTSGTAAAHFHAAVIEADLSAVPLLVCTADRPPELWGRGAPQTIDQTELYGRSVRAFIEPGPPDDLDVDEFRVVARSAWEAATGPMPGPVHLNLSFREPLTGTPEPLPAPLPPRSVAEPVEPEPSLVGHLARSLDSARGVIIAGRGESAPNDVLRLAERLGWPVLADHRSGCRSPGHPSVIAHYDSLLRHRPFAERVRPQVVLRLGEIVSSKAVSLWLRDLDATVLAGRPHGRHIDPEAIADQQFDETCTVAALLAALETNPPSTNVDTDWLSTWRRADDVAAKAIADTLAPATDQTAPGTGSQPKRPTDEITVAQRVVAAVPPGGALVVASSMPVRDVEWFGPNRDDIAVYSNRGANGIDGTIATAIGVAATGVPTMVLVGDVAFLHDASSLTALARRSIDLTIVVVDNDGGGIFSFLPQHGLLTHDRYEQVFGTPHGTDLIALSRAHGIEAGPWSVDDDLRPDGVRVVVASSDRAANLALHDAVHAAVAAQL